MTIFDWITASILVILLGTAVYTDLRFGKIYNKLTLSCIIIGLTLNAAANGWTGLLHSLAGVVFVLVLYLAFAPLAGIGGGDVKLLMAVGALVGLPLTLNLTDNLFLRAVLFTAIIGGVLSLVVMARHRAMLATTKGMAKSIYLKLIMRVPVDLVSGSGGIKFRYSPAIALGTLFAFLVKV